MSVGDTRGSTPPQPYAWMETLLRLYYARVEKAEGLRLLGDHEGRIALLKRWQGELAAAGMPADLPERDEGRQLSVAVLALRLKFEQPDALERVRKNISMRAAAAERGG